MHAKKPVERDQKSSPEVNPTNQQTAGGGDSQAGLRVAVSNPVSSKVQTGVVDSRGLLLDRQALVLRLVAEFLDQSSFDASLAALAGELQHRFRCDRVVIGLISANGLRIQVISQQSQIDQLSGEVVLLTEALQEACDQDRTIQYPANKLELTITQAHARLATGRQHPQICTIPLCHQERFVGAILFDLESTQSWSRFTLTLMQQIADLVAPLIELRQQAEKSLVSLAKARVRNLATSLLKPEHLLTKFALLLSILILVATHFIPVTHRINSAAEVTPVEKRVVASPLRGYLQQVNVKNGDSIIAGQTLVKLETRDLELEQINRENDIHSARTELRSAMASHERKDMAIAQARLDQAQAQLDLISQQITRSTLIAPVDGIIINGDLTQSLGAPVERGDALFEIAPSGGYKVYLMVAEADVGYVSIGQRGQLTLKSDPGDALPIVVSNIHPVAIGANGVNRFRVEANFESEIQSIRPGQTGIAKLEAGKTNLLWSTSHQFVDWLRLHVWEWFG